MTYIHSLCYLGKGGRFQNDVATNQLLTKIRLWTLMPVLLYIYLLLKFLITPKIKHFGSPTVIALQVFMIFFLCILNTTTSRGKLSCTLHTIMCYKCSVRIWLIFYWISTHFRHFFWHTNIYFSTHGNHGKFCFEKD